MIQKSLIPYIKQQLKNGYSIDVIRAAILNQGYSHFDTEDSINHATGKVLISSPIPIQPPKRMGFFQKMETVMFHPKFFFEEIKTEGIGPSILYLFIMICIFMVVFSVMTIVAAMQINPGVINAGSIAIGAISLIAALILIFIIFVLSMLLSAVTTQLIAKLLGGKGEYTDTFKASVYGSTPAWIFGIIIAIVIVPTLIFLPDFFNLKTLVPTGEIVEPPNLSSFGMAGLFFTVVILIAGLWSLIIYLKGLGQLHQKNAWWALAVIVIKAIIDVIVFSILIMLLGLLVGGLLMGLLTTFMLSAGAPPLA